MAPTAWSSWTKPASSAPASPAFSHHHLNPDVFVCPLSPPGNHLPMRIEVGERALIHSTGDQS
ncbi:hypothetical protein ACQP2K_19235 [Microbispora siamensis]